MSDFQKFQEYLTAKKTLVKTPKTEVVPDYPGPDGKTPPTEKGGKKAAPYKAAGSDKGSQKCEKGLADKGSIAPYKPKLEEKPKTLPTFPKGKTESFLNTTKDMSLSEFTAFMLNECGCTTMEEEGLPTVTSYVAGKFHPHPPEVIKYISALSEKNERILENLIHELKRSGLLGKALKNMLSHNESYDELTRLLGEESDGQNRARAFARSMNENYSKFLEEHNSLFEHVGPPMGEEDEEDPDEEEEEDSEDVPSDDSDEFGDEENSDDEFGSEDEMSPSEDGDDGEVPSDDEMSSSDEDMPPEEPKKFKKKLPFHHVIDSMKNYEPMANYMRNY